MDVCAAFFEKEFAALEVVFFAPPARGRECGNYFGTRFHFRKTILQTVTIFCFYNGQDKSPCFCDRSQAMLWLRKIGEKHQTIYNTEVDREA